MYIKENGEIFHFVDQFSSCPALANQCSERTGISNLNKLLDEMKTKKILKDFKNENLIAILFSPVKKIASNQCIEDVQQVELLKEMTMIMQIALLL